MFYEICFPLPVPQKSNVPNLLPLPASFFKMLPLPQRLNRFRISDLDIRIQIR